jgi:hypothetical protein
VIPIAITLLVGTITEGVVALLGTANGVTGALAGGGLAMALAAVSARRSRHLKGVFLEALRLRAPETREEASHALGRILASARPGGHASQEHFAELTLLAVRALTEVHRLDEASKLLDDVDLGRLTPGRAAIVAQALATCRVRAGDVAGAKAVLAHVARPADNEAVERWMQALDALFSALDGDSEDALKKAAEIEDSEDGALTSENLASIRASLHLVRTHAYAALGKTTEARAELAALRALAGSAGLDQAIHPEGPASPMARRMRAEDPAV